MKVNVSTWTLDSTATGLKVTRTTDDLLACVGWTFVTLLPVRLKGREEVAYCTTHSEWPAQYKKLSTESKEAYKMFARKEIRYVRHQSTKMYKKVFSFYMRNETCITHFDILKGSWTVRGNSDESMQTTKKLFLKDYIVSVTIAASTEASPQLRGLPAGDFGWQYTPWSCLRPASKPKAEEEEVKSAALSGTYSGVNAIY